MRISVYFISRCIAYLLKDTIILGLANLLSTPQLKELNNLTKHFDQCFQIEGSPCYYLALLHLENPKLYTILAFLSAIGLITHFSFYVTLERIFHHVILLI